MLMVQILPLILINFNGAPDIFMLAQWTLKQEVKPGSAPLTPEMGENEHCMHTSVSLHLQQPALITKQW